MNKYIREHKSQKRKKRFSYFDIQKHPSKKLLSKKQKHDNPKSISNLNWSLYKRKRHSQSNTV